MSSINLHTSHTSNNWGQQIWSFTFEINHKISHKFKDRIIIMANASGLNASVMNQCWINVIKNVTAFREKIPGFLGTTNFQQHLGHVVSKIWSVRYSLFRSTFAFTLFPITSYTFDLISRINDFCTSKHGTLDQHYMAYKYLSLWYTDMQSNDVLKSWEATLREVAMIWHTCNDFFYWMKMDIVLEYM